LKQVIAPVISNSEVMPGVHLIWLEAPQISSEAQPGQFVMVRCGEDTLLRRPLSIHQVAGGKMALLFSIVGKGTDWLSGRQEGDTVDILGPLGNGFSIHPDAKKLLLVAGGIGIAPLYFLAQEAINKGQSVIMIYGAQNKTQLYPEQRLPAGAKLFAATDDGSVGYHGLVTDLIPDYVKQADQVFACGPMPMYKTMAQMPELKNKPVQVSLEIMMGCGRGLCYGCSIKTKQGMKKVCADGPVFELDDILWDEINHR